jgi:hypothetical protein
MPTLILGRKAADNHISISIGTGVGAKHLLLLLTPPPLQEALRSGRDFFESCYVFEDITHLIEPEVFVRASDAR